MLLEDQARSGFPSDFANGRRRMLAAAAALGAKVRSYPELLFGPNGENLATDTTWIGPEDARRVLVLLSATHGVEGFCGSACQTDFLRHGLASGLPPEVAVLVVHALDPHGFAWLRRVTPEGVDLNRNFVDFSQPLPVNPGYEALAPALVLDSLGPDRVAASDACLADYAAQHGREAFEIAVSGGQFLHASGLFYGGAAPTRARLRVESLIRDHDLTSRRVVGVIDFHTGLGPFGYGEPICDHAPGSRGVDLCRDWYGWSVTEPALATSSSVAKVGLSDHGWQAMLGDRVAFIALEFGTFDTDAMFRVLRADHTLHARGAVDWTAPETRRVKEAIRRHFFPDTQDWREMVLFRGRQVIGQALRGLART